LRQINVQWGNLYQGFQELHRLSNQPQLETGPKDSAERHLQQRRLERQRRHARIRQQAYLQARSTWLDRLSAAQTRFYLVLVVGGLLAVAAFLSLVGIPVSLALAWWIYREYRNWDALRQAPPPEPLVLPDSSADEASLKKHRAALEAAWWSRLAKGNGNGRVDDFGTPGVETVIELFDSSLPNSFMALREVQVRSRLDVDVLLVGPNGIWLLECKHWAGEIKCHAGNWSHTNMYYGKGGSLKEKTTEHTQDPDDQWLSERDSVIETLRRRLPGLPWLTEHVRGGVVFTHPDAELKIDRSTRAACGRPAAWLKRIRQTLPIKEMGLPEQLQIIDALLYYASTLDSQYASRPADRMVSSLKIKS
jgi:predicted alpha/beta hydrolase family esterase